MPAVPLGLGFKDQLLAILHEGLLEIASDLVLNDVVAYKVLSSWGKFILRSIPS